MQTHRLLSQLVRTVLRAPIVRAGGAAVAPTGASTPLPRASAFNPCTASAGASTTSKQHHSKDGALTTTRTMSTWSHPHGDGRVRTLAHDAPLSTARKLNGKGKMTEKADLTAAPLGNIKGAWTQSRAPPLHAKGGKVKPCRSTRAESKPGLPSALKMGRITRGSRLKSPSPPPARGSIVGGRSTDSSTIAQYSAHRGSVDVDGGVGLVMPKLLNNPAPTFGTNLASITGVIKDVVDYNESNGFTVCIIRATDVVPTIDTRDVTVVGAMPRALPGENVVVKGRWIQDAKYGTALEARAPIEVSDLPASISNIQDFILSLGIKGLDDIALHRLHYLAVGYGIEIVDIFQRKEHRHVLGLLPGVGQATLDAIAEQWDEMRELRKLTNFLVANGGMSTETGMRTAEKLHMEFNLLPDSVSARTQLFMDPFALVTMQLLDFRVAEKIASSVHRDNPEKLMRLRVAAAVLQALKATESSGNSGIPSAQLTARIAKRLQIPEEVIDLTTILATGTIVVAEIDGEECVFEKSLYEAEQRIALRIIALAEGEPRWEIFKETLEDAIDDAVESAGEHNFALSSSQMTAIQAALQNKVTVVTGGAGVGKTKVLDILARVLSRAGIPEDDGSGNVSYGHVQMGFAAPTGRAAARLVESTGYPATTLHRMLGVHKDGTIERDADNPLEYDLVVVDESSMVDARLFDMLLNAMRDEASLLIVGDDNQLPSIGAGDVLKDLLEARVGAVVRLLEVHRQAEESSLVRISHSILQGEVPQMSETIEADEDFTFLPMDEYSAHETIDRLKELVMSDLPKRFGIDAVKDIQVLCPMKTRGAFSVKPLNEMLQEALNPSVDQRDQQIKGLQNTFRMGDKVMQIVNCEKKAVNNGETGVVTFLNLKSSAKESLQITFSNARGKSRVVSYSHSELDEHLTLSYATTIHKSQGCEYPAVVVVLSSDQLMMLSRSLLYTAVTRARRAVVVVGTSSSLRYAIRNDDRGDVFDESTGRRRWTMLGNFLRDHKEKQKRQRVIDIMATRAIGGE